MRYLIMFTALHCLIPPALAADIQGPARIDVGSPGDERCVGEGFYHHEGPNPKSKWKLVSREPFRWAKNRFTLKLPVSPKRHNEVALRAIFRGPMVVRAGETWKTVVTGSGKDGETVRFTLPAEVVGDRSEVPVRFAAVYPRKAGPRDKRTLFLILSEVQVRPVAELSPEAALDATPLPPSPADHRDCLRNIERRPPVSDPVAYAELLAAEWANVVTLGTMNGRGLVFFPTDLAATDPKMDADYLPRVISELRKRDIHVMSWVVFNIQDVRNADDFMPIQRFPQWRMVGIEEPGKKYPPRVGMCVVSSPFIEHHAKVLKQAAAFDIDGFFFDSFYYTEMPRPAPPGCVCDFCRERFKKDTGLELPDLVELAGSGKVRVEEPLEMP